MLLAWLTNQSLGRPEIVRLLSTSSHLEKTGASQLATPVIEISPFSSKPIQVSFTSIYNSEDGSGSVSYLNSFTEVHVLQM